MLQSLCFMLYFCGACLALSICIDTNVSLHRRSFPSPREIIMIALWPLTAILLLFFSTSRLNK